MITLAEAIEEGLLNEDDQNEIAENGCLIWQGPPYCIQSFMGMEQGNGQRYRFSLETRNCRCNGCAPVHTDAGQITIIYPDVEGQLHSLDYGQEARAGVHAGFWGTGHCKPPNNVEVTLGNDKVIFQCFEGTIDVHQRGQDTVNTFEVTIYWRVGAPIINGGMDNGPQVFHDPVKSKSLVTRNRDKGGPSGRIGHRGNTRS